MMFYTKQKKDDAAFRFENFKENLLGVVFSCNDLPRLVGAIKSDDLLQQYYGLIGLRKLLDPSQDLLLQSIAEADLIPKLIEFLQKDHELQVFLIFPIKFYFYKSYSLKQYVYCQF